MVVVVVGSGWLSSIDNKVTFPWEAAWGSRGRPPSRAAGPPPLREETTEGHQPAGGEGGERRRSGNKVKPGGSWSRRKEEASLEVLSTGSKECEKADGSGRRRHTSQFSNIRMDGLFCLSSWQAANALTASYPELTGKSRFVLVTFRSCEGTVQICCPDVCGWGQISR